jgi:hypothetical protein
MELYFAYQTVRYECYKSNSIVTNGAIYSGKKAESLEETCSVIVKWEIWVE